MEELKKPDAFDLLRELLKEIKSNSCEENEVYSYMLRKIMRTQERIKNSDESDMTLKMDVERTLYYMLVDLQRHIPVAKKQSFIRKLFCLAKREYPYDCIRVVLDKIMTEELLMKQLPSDFHLELLTKLRLSHLDISLRMLKKIKNLVKLKKLKLAYIRVNGKLMASVSDQLGYWLPAQLESLNLSGNELGLYYDDNHNVLKFKLQNLFLNIWRLAKLLKLNISNNLIDNEFFIEVCLGYMDERNITLKKLIARANLLSASGVERCTAKIPPPNIFGRFCKKFEFAKIDLAFNFIEDISEEARTLGREASDLLISYEGKCGYVESVIMPEYFISREKPLAIMVHLNSRAFVLVEEMINDPYLQITLRYIKPTQHISTQGIGAAFGAAAWEYTSSLRAYLTEHYKNYSFSRHVLRTHDDINVLTSRMSIERPFNRYGCGAGNENCYTYCVKGFNATTTNSQNKIKERWGNPCFHLVRDRPSSVNRHFFFKTKTVSVDTKAYGDVEAVNLSNPESFSH
jgi:hypothetical protein